MIKLPLSTTSQGNLAVACEQQTYRSASESTQGRALWLSGRVLDLRSRGSGSEPHQRHCIVSLSMTHYPLLITGQTQEDPSRHEGLKKC